MRRGAQCGIAAAILAALLLAAILAGLAPDAQAQAGPGAERYEVTISPPKRPGSEQADPVEVPRDEGSAPAGAAGAGDDLGSVGAETAPGAAADVAQEQPAPAAPAPAATAAKAAAAGPPRALQVGAYRERSRADSVYQSLRRSFDHVTVAAVESGGQPLYRVYVGRLPKGPALDDLKRRLAAAGYPSFDVPAPSLPAAN